MLHFFRRERIHEPIAVGAVIAAAVSLNVMWMLNLLSYRFAGLEQSLTLIPNVGTGTGLFLAGFITFLFVWACVAVLLRGRDCSDYRDRAFWFFVLTIVLYLVFTFPPVFGTVILK